MLQNVVIFSVNTGHVLLLATYNSSHDNYPGNTRQLNISQKTSLVSCYMLGDQTVPVSLLAYYAAHS